MFEASASVSGVTNPAVFSLDNIAPRIDPSADPRTATIGDRFRAPLAVTVRGADGKPVAGASITFTLGSSSGNGSSSASTAGATFPGGTTQTTVTTDAAGRAVSPLFTANTVAGNFLASASTAGTSAATFTLRNLAGKPTTITCGAATGESTALGTRFPVRFAVTVTDAHDNPVKGVTVTFAAPRHGASGVFDRGKPIAKVKTDTKGIAVAPAFVANHTQGGYVVRATVAGHSTGFAAINATG
jgi:hypothetical protein